MTNQKPETISPAKVGEGPDTTLLGIAVGLLAVAVAVLGGLALFNPVSLISLAPDWFAEPGTAQILAATALALLIAGLLHQAVRVANRGHDQAATWLTLGALIMVPWFSVV